MLSPTPSRSSRLSRGTSTKSVSSVYFTTDDAGFVALKSCESRTDVKRPLTVSWWKPCAICTKYSPSVGTV